MSCYISSIGAQSRERACKSKFLPSRVQNLFLLQHQRPVLPVASNQLVFWAATDYYSGPSRVKTAVACPAQLCLSFCKLWAGFSYDEVMCLVCGKQPTHILGTRRILLGSKPGEHRGCLSCTCATCAGPFVYL